MVRPMTKRALLLILSAALASPLMTPTPAQAGDGVVLIVNQRNPTKKVSVAEAKSLFLGNTTRWQGVVPVKLCVRTKDSKAKGFYQGVLEMSASKFFSHWASRQLAGRGVQPDAFAGVSELLADLKKNPGAVGFALESELAGADLSGLRVVKLE